MKILLLCSAFNGLSQRVWLELRASGHEVEVALPSGASSMAVAVARADPELIVCPFLRERVPEEVWANHRTIIIHPGPLGDRGPSALDWAVADAERVWGVTALQAVEEMDAGPVWATRTFAVGAETPRKSSLYNGPVADAAVELVHEVVGKAADPGFAPRPLGRGAAEVIGRARPLMRQEDRAFSWADDTAHVLRRIRCGDGSPGVRTELLGLPVSVFDAHPAADAGPGEPGSVAALRHGAILVRTGDGALWVGHARPVPQDGEATIKLPAATVLGERLAGVPALPTTFEPDDDKRGYREIAYRRVGPIGTLAFSFYNGAMSTSQCRRLAAALRHAAAQDTTVLVLRGGEVFSNGIHLNAIEAAPRPAMEAWYNINAVNDVCRGIIQCVRQLVVAAVEGNAGAGGVMLALGADQVLLRQGVVLNPHYRTMGLYGSEYWTFVLPRRAGRPEAERLTTRCLPVGTDEALRLGLADAVLPRHPVAFEEALDDHLQRLVRDQERLVAAKRDRLSSDLERKPLEAYRAEELGRMNEDIFADRHGFAASRRAFVTKRRGTAGSGGHVGSGGHGGSSGEPPRQ
ncbi:enoyl-CoA hydratase-related protein [Wenjunlia tyrosinilytica]|uniref:Formyl transferase n=1 Tax=Wenjunlia tyrosinilytica TaxID=1544741 RepID=A0A917ZYR5_9ACTN|nr:enoyl-CoA hydratase-related protein [Wenjunlia tyrosinilytica]GGO97818.1 formyl transferase [Wenjunlia tyrosinilytica]